VSALHLLPGDRILAADPASTTILDAHTGAELAAIPHGLRAEPSPDAALIATGGEDGRVILWDRATAAQLRILGALPQRLMALRWSGDGRILAAIDAAGEVRVWRRDGTLVRALPAARHGIDVALSHDARWLARASDGDPFQLYALDGGRDRDIAVPLRQRFAAAFAPDDAQLLVAGAGFVVVADVATGAALTTIQPRTDILAARFSADRAAIYGGGNDRMVRVWDARTGTEIASRRAPGEIYGLVAGDDRLAILTDGAALIWRTSSFTGDPAALRALAACRTDHEVSAGALRQRPRAKACPAE
jgi:WD40 repeat protein